MYAMSMDPVSNKIINNVTNNAKRYIEELANKYEIYACSDEEIQSGIKNCIRYNTNLVITEAICDGEAYTIISKKKFSNKDVQLIAICYYIIDCGVNQDTLDMIKSKGFINKFPEINENLTASEILAKKFNNRYSNKDHRQLLDVTISFSVDCNKLNIYVGNLSYDLSNPNTDPDKIMERIAKLILNED